METKLVSVSHPLIIVPDPEQGVTPVPVGGWNGPRYMTAEEFVVYIARVSNPSNQMNVETGSKLIRYLIKHKHWSPFEHVSCTFEIKTSRAIAAQILRHRSFTFQEFSQRYAEVLRLEKLQWRKQGKTNRQVGDEETDLTLELHQAVSIAQGAALMAYGKLLEAGVAKECARMVLPLNTETTMYMTGTLRSWIHYLELRCTEHTQKEHRDIALNIKKDLAGEFPEVFKALDEINAR